MRQGGGVLVAAEASDFKTFATEESYVVEGVSINFTQKVGEATIKVKVSATARNEGTPSTLTANGASFDRERDLPGQAGFYKLRSDGPITDAASKAALDSLNQDDDIEYAYPVYVNPATGNRLFLNDELVVQVKPSATLQEITSLSGFSLRLVNQLPGATNTYVLRLTEPKDFNPFRVCDSLRQSTNVNWVEPNKIQEFRQFAIPDDALFDDQWHLLNTGQTSAFSDADLDAEDAWDSGYGSPGIRIAILDDGVQTDHPDLEDNIVAGYDFYDNDSNPDPDHANDNHGTAVAGLAAAAVDNDETGVAGVAGRCQILPVRILENNTFASDATIASALVYAADNADVINCSWGGGSPSSILNTAFSYASTSGRGGYGCVVLCSSGNFAGGLGGNSYFGPQDGPRQTRNVFNVYGAGNYFLGFGYVKDASGSANDDCFWLADIVMPDGTPVRLDSDTLPANWQTGGDANWSVSNDPEHAHGTTSFAWRSGAISDDEASLLITPLTTISSSQSSISFRTWISSAIGDEAGLYVFNSLGQLLPLYFPIGQGSVANRVTDVAYPAELSTVLAVGSSTDFDYRSHYSQYDSTLDFVAPSSGGYWGAVTTDRTGSAGYESGDYVTTFGGTSASAPMAAGVAALVLSKNGKQTRSTVASKLIDNCDQIGPVTYTSGRNDYYGYGRLNAYASVNDTTADSSAPGFTSIAVIHHRAVDVTFSEPMGEGALNPANYSVTEGGANLPSSNPSRVVRVALVLSGYLSWSHKFRLIWDSGYIAESGTVTVAASSSIKDVAGNAVTGTLSKSATGTKRLLGVNCGSTDASSAYFSYTPPFLTDNGWQGNEPAVFLTSSGSYNYTFTSPSVDTTGISDPAPQAVYQSLRTVSNPYDPESIIYQLPNMPASGNKVRVHITNITDIYGYEIFDIYINGSYKGTHYAGGSYPKAHVKEYSGITSSGGVIEVEIAPQESYYGGDYRASISGVEVVKP